MTIYSSKKIKVAVLMGGRSKEHFVSLASGIEVVKNLDRSKYKVYPVVISKNDTKWTRTTTRSLNKLNSPFEIEKEHGLYKLEDSKIITIDSIVKICDVVFLALHGPYGEDGTIQGLLEYLSIPYTGSGVLSSAQAMDKFATKTILKSFNINTPEGILINKADDLAKINFKNTKVFVKPNSLGSSVGSTLVDQPTKIKGAIKKAFKYDDKVLVEQYIEGKELTCAVLGNDDPLLLPLIEIKTNNKYFNYKAKYTAKDTHEIVPAPISDSLTREVQKIAKEVYKILGCSGFARVDFRLDRQNNPFVLEVNTIPGLTPVSLFPKAAQAAGISYPVLLNKIINFALMQ